MKLSLVIPTKDRLDTLRHCVASALATRNDQLEIVVSDNHSVDGTAEFLAGLSDPRLKIVKPPTPMSMRGHYDFVLTQTAGDYIVYIGDDDAIAPFGPDALLELIRRTGADAIAWKPIGYLWPGMAGEGSFASTLLKPKHFALLAERVDADQAFEAFLKAQQPSYLNGAKIYHGAVSRDVVNRLTAQSGGSYFGAMSPDVYAAIFGLKFAQNFVRTTCSITVSGKSRHSSGWALLKAKRDKDVAQKFFDDELQAKQRDPENRIDLSVRATASHELNALMIGNDALFGGALDIDYSAWVQKIASSFSYSDQAEYDHSVAKIEAMVAALGATPPTLPAYKTPGPAKPTIGARERVHSSGHWEVHSEKFPNINLFCHSLDFSVTDLSQGAVGARLSWRKRRRLISSRMAAL